MLIKHMQSGRLFFQFENQQQYGYNWVDNFAFLRIEVVLSTHKSSFAGVNSTIPRGHVGDLNGSVIMLDMGP